MRDSCPHPGHILRWLMGDALRSEYFKTGGCIICDRVCNKDLDVSGKRQKLLRKKILSSPHEYVVIKSLKYYVNKLFFDLR